jgi:regulator of cell morphogenesis and NO signaling
MNITSQNTVGEVAAAFPSTIQVFEQYRIDYCCGGDQSIADACSKQRVAVDALIDQLKQATQVPPPPHTQDWTKTSLTALVDHILDTHHRYLYDAIPRLHQIVLKVISVHGESHPESLPPLGKVFEALEGELDVHMFKEERVLFPWLKEMESVQKTGVPPTEVLCGSVNNPIRVMRHEHDNAGHALAEMRRLTDDYTLPEDACNTYRALFQGLVELEGDLHQHIHLENNILFPRAIELEATLMGESQ